MMMGSTSAYRWILLACWFLTNLSSSSWALDIHITNSQSIGDVLFNVSLGRSWSYKFDAVKSSYTGQKLFKVDAKTGVVILQDTPDCSKLYHNPFSVYIEARTLVSEPLLNFTVIPLNVQVHGANCYSKYRRKWDAQRANTQVLALDSGLKIQSCHDRGVHLASLKDFIPKVSRTCSFQYRINNERDFKLDQVTGDLSTRLPFCMMQKQTVLNAVLVAPCNKYIDTLEVPLKIVLFARGQPVHVPFGVQPVGLHHSRIKRNLRVKRARKPPVFAQMLYVKNIPEEQNAGFVVTTISVSSSSGPVTYSLLATRDGRSQNMFTIDPSSGLVTTTAKLDRESIPIHYFQVIATDVRNAQLNGATQLNIYVDDVNDHTPKFENTVYARAVSEYLSVGSTVLTVRATDEDSGDNAEIRYSILNPSGVNDVFRIDPRSGSITTRLHLDREKTDFYRLRVQAVDNGPVQGRKSATATVEVTVLDENDNYPQFSQSSYSINVPEDRDPSKNPLITTIIATDADAGPSQSIRYSITGGNTYDTFNIDALSGKLILQKNLNFEQVRQYRLYIRAQDGGSPPKSNSTVMLVKVTDRNDNAPKFYNNLFQESVLENVNIGYSILRVQAFDSDDGVNAAIQYKITDAQPDMPIVINPTSGFITTSSKLDREKSHTYAFKVEAADGGTPPLTATTSVVVSVRDINDNPPIFNPRVYNQVVSEEDPPGTPVVTLTAKDADENEHARVSYSITSGNINNAFNLISQMGQGIISIARPLNYKEQSRYILTVKASDTGNLVDTATVFINVSDANLNRPAFQGAPYRIRVDEDTPIGKVIYKVSATDGDVGENARISYSLDNSDVFAINSNTGELSVKKSLDRETTSGYALSVTATDHGRPPLQDTTDCEITVQDVNDNSPVFEKNVYNGHVIEDAVVGTSVMRIVATDSDQGVNGMLRYTFEDGRLVSKTGDFRIDATLGDIRTAKELDRENIANYELKAFAVDRGTPRRSTSVIVNIKIDDVNDNGPVFPSQTIYLKIFENSPIGTTVDKIMAKDPDEGVNAEVVYSIVGGEDSDSFHLTSKDPAVLTTEIELDYEGGKKEYTIVVRAASQFRMSDASVIIQVQDVNDNVPVMNDFVIIFNNFKNHFPTGTIGHVPASDPDVNDRLNYTFISGNEAHVLDLNSETGMLKLDSRLNSDVPKNGTLQVRVSGESCFKTFIFKL